MAAVKVALNGRHYLIACEAGQEAHVGEVAGLVDARMRQLAESFGGVDETRLLVMTCLLLADELSAEGETRSARAREMADAVVAVGREDLRAAAYDEGYVAGRADALAEADDIADAMEALAERVETATRRLDG